MTSLYFSTHPLGTTGQSMLSRRTLCEPLGQSMLFRRTLQEPLGQSMLSRRTLWEPLGQSMLSRGTLWELLGYSMLFMTKLRSIIKFYNIHLLLNIRDNNIRLKSNLRLFHFHIYVFPTLGDTLYGYHILHDTGITCAILSVYIALIKYQYVKYFFVVYLGNHPNLYHV